MKLYFNKFFMIFGLIFLLGIVFAYCYAENPTPTFIWKSNPLPTPIFRGSQKWTPSSIDNQDWKGNEWEQEQILKGGNVTSAHVTASNMKAEPNPPTGFIIEPGNGIAHLIWNPMPGALSYLLYISEDGKTFKRRLKKPIHNHEIVISVLKNHKTYYFGVVCVGPYGRETKMTIQSVVPKKRLSN